MRISGRLLVVQEQLCCNRGGGSVHVPPCGKRSCTLCARRWRIARPVDGSTGQGRRRCTAALAKMPKMASSGTCSIAQRAEAPIGEPAATDAHEVHESVAGRAQLGAGDLAEDRHVVAIEEAPADAEEDEKGNGDPEQAGLRRVPTPNIAGTISDIPIALT